MERVTVSWEQPAGCPRQTQGKCLDVTENGVSFQLADPIARQTYISFRVPDLKLNGAGSVRHCTRTGTKYTVGVEFCGGLRWTPWAGHSIV